MYVYLFSPKNNSFYFHSLGFVQLPIPLLLSAPEPLWFHLFMDNFSMWHTPFIFTIFFCPWLFWASIFLRWYIHQLSLTTRIVFILISVLPTQSCIVPFNSQVCTYSNTEIQHFWDLENNLSNYILLSVISIMPSPLSLLKFFTHN